MSLNRATIIGYLGQDPELRNLPTNGQPVASFAVATDESFTDKDGNRQERVDWRARGVKSTSKAICARANTKPATTAANVIAPRSLRSGYNFSGQGRTCLPAVRPKNQQRPKRCHSKRRECSRESAGGILLTLWLR